jgi:hypothetical protein
VDKVRKCKSGVLATAPYLAICYARLMTLRRIDAMKANTLSVNFDCVAVDHGCAPDDSRWRGRDNRGSCPRCALHCLDGL